METEILKNWFSMNVAEKRLTLYSIAYALKTKKFETLNRLFDLGNPDVYFGKKDNKPYIRLSDEGKKIMALLITEYLNK